MANTVAGVLLPAGTHAARPAASSVSAGTLYPESDTGLIYQSDGVSVWTLWATLGGTPQANAAVRVYAFRTFR